MSNTLLQRQTAMLVYSVCLYNNYFGLFNFCLQHIRPIGTQQNHFLTENDWTHWVYDFLPNLLSPSEKTFALQFFLCQRAVNISGRSHAVLSYLILISARLRCYITKTVKKYMVNRKKYNLTNLKMYFFLLDSLRRISSYLILVSFLDLFKTYILALHTN